MPKSVFGHDYTPPNLHSGPFIIYNITLFHQKYGKKYWPVTFLEVEKSKIKVKGQGQRSKTLKFRNSFFDRNFVAYGLIYFKQRSHCSNSWDGYALYLAVQIFLFVICFRTALRYGTYA